MALSDLQNEPVATKGVVAIVLSLLTPVLLKWGIDSSAAQQLVTVGAGIVTGVLSFVAILRARKQVTPIVAPRDNDGATLVPADVVAPLPEPDTTWQPDTNVVVDE